MKIKFLFLFLCVLVSASAPFVSAASVETYRARDVHSFLLSNEWVNDNVLRTVLIFLQNPIIPNATATGNVFVHVLEYDYGDGTEEGHISFSAFASGQIPLTAMSIDQSLSTASVTNAVLVGQQAVIDVNGNGVFVPAQFTLSLVLSAGDEKMVNAIWNDSLDFGCVVYRFKSIEQRKNVTPTVFSVLLDGTEMMGGAETVLSAWNARTQNMFITRTTKDECSF